MKPVSLLTPFPLPLFLSYVLQLPYLATAQKQPTCYWEYLNRIDSAGNDGPCGTWNGSTVLECCSSGDTCLGDNICYGLGGSHKNGSGYYLSGCTDITLVDPACTPHCGSNGYPDIVYNATTKQWACCTVEDFNVNCKIPTTESWSAPAPSQLTGTFVAHSSTATPQSLLPSDTAATSSTTASATSSSLTTSSSTSTSTTVAAAAATATGSATSITTDSDPLSTGAKAGISVGVALAFLLAMGGIIAGLRQKRLRARAVSNSIALENTRNDKANLPYYGYGGGSGYYQVPNQAPVTDRHYYEMSPDPNPVELSGTVNPVELGNWDNYDQGNYSIPEPVKVHQTYYHP